MVEIFSWKTSVDLDGKAWPGTHCVWFLSAVSPGSSSLMNAAHQFTRVGDWLLLMVEDLPIPM